MGQNSFEELEEYYADLVLVKRITPHKATSALVYMFPDAKGLDYLIALCSSATVVEAEASKNSAVPLPNHVEIYKMAAMLAVDLLDLLESNEVPATGRDLISHWKRNRDKLFSDVVPSI